MSWLLVGRCYFVSMLLRILQFSFLESFDFEMSRKFSKKLKTTVISKPVDEDMDAYNMVSSKTLSLFWFMIKKFDDVTS